MSATRTTALHLTQCPRCDHETTWLLPEDFEPAPGDEWVCESCGETYTEENGR